MRTSVTKRKGRGGITLGLIVIGLLLVFGILISNILPSNSTPVVNGEIDTSRYVKLSMFLIGPSSTEAIIGYQDMVAQLNGDLKENINANVEVTFVPLDQVDREYLLAFNSKKAYDVIYTSADAHPSYFGLVEEDAFKDLDDILPIYAKNIWENINLIAGMMPDIREDLWDTLRSRSVYGKRIYLQ